MVFPNFSLTWAAEEIFPDRPINLVVSHGTRAGSWIRKGRLSGIGWGRFWGSPSSGCTNPAGAGCWRASFVAKAKPDGYTLFTGTSSNLVLPPVLKKLDYGLKDFVPLGIYCKGVVHVFVKKDAPWKTLQEFVEEAKKRPLKVSSYGKNSHAEAVIEALSKQAGITLAHVPYKSCGEAVTALLGGHVDADFCTWAIGQVDSGAVRVLAVADYERVETLSGGAHGQRVGYPVALPLWYSLLAPRQDSPEK